jgi:adenylyltransferase/sulfurtransferase
MAGTIGMFQSNEAIKLITGIGDSLIGQLVIYDALEAQVRKVRIRKDPNCAVCGENPTVTELIDYEAFCGTISVEAADAARESTISARDLAQMLQERERGERDFLLVDVREPAEREIVDIDGSVLIPKNDFLLGSALEQLPQDKPVVFYCKVGNRSAEVLAVAKGAGFANAQHVGGGVVAWVNQIEPAKPIY